MNYKPFLIIVSLSLVLSLVSAQLGFNNPYLPHVDSPPSTSSGGGSSNVTTEFRQQYSWFGAQRAVAMPPATTVYLATGLINSPTSGIIVPCNGSIVSLTGDLDVSSITASFGTTHRFQARINNNIAMTANISGITSNGQYTVVENAAEDIFNVSSGDRIQLSMSHSNSGLNENYTAFAFSLIGVVCR